MKRGFMNGKSISSPTKTANSGKQTSTLPENPANGSPPIPKSSSVAGNLTSIEKQLSSLDLKKDEHGRPDIVRLNYPHTAPNNSERRVDYVGFEDSEIIGSKQCPYSDVHPPDRHIVSVIPQIKGIGPASDDYTSCNFPKKVYDRIFSTPNFCLDVPGPHQNDTTTGYTVTEVAGKGLGALATRNIKGGEVVVAERPLLIMPVGTTTGELFKSKPRNWTQEDLLIASLQETERHLDLTLISNMTSKKRAAFFALNNSHTADGSGPIIGRVRTNGFEVSDLLEIGDERDDVAKKLSGICDVGSRFNHSCAPNVAREFDLRSFSFVFFASRDIKAGEELTVSYCSVDRAVAERNKDLAPYSFQCKCKRCVNPIDSDRTLGMAFFYVQCVGKALLDKNMPADVVRQMALQAYNIVEKDCLHGSMLFIRAVELVIIVYQMLGDSQSAIQYSRIHASAIRGYTNVYPATLRRHWADLSSYRAFHQCSPWWRARAASASKNGTARLESFKDYFDPEKSGSLHADYGLVKLSSHCVRTMLLKIPPTADSLDSDGLGLGVASASTDQSTHPSALGAKETDAGVDMYTTIIDALQSMQKKSDPIANLFQADRARSHPESEVVLFLAVKAGFIKASGGTEDEIKARIQEVIRRTGSDGRGTV